MGRRHESDREVDDGSWGRFVVTSSIATLPIAIPMAWLIGLTDERLAAEPGCGIFICSMVMLVPVVCVRTAGFGLGDAFPGIAARLQRLRARLRSMLQARRWGREWPTASARYRDKGDAGGRRRG
jgi:hypothetical protein